MESKAKFTKGEYINHENLNWQCIVCDNEYSVFGLVTAPMMGGISTSFEQTFICSNDTTIPDIEFERIDNIYDCYTF